MRGGAEHAESAGAADRGHHVAAMTERQQRKFNSQHVADRRFHGGLLPAAAFLRCSLPVLNFANSKADASALGVGKPSRFPSSGLARRGYETRSRASTFRLAKYATRQRSFAACAFRTAVECWFAISGNRRECE